MNARDTRLLGLVLGLRDPLSRIELALAEGGSDKVVPARFAERVRAAVAEADARLEALLRALRAGAGETPPDADCRPTLDEVAERMRGPLAARGLSLDVQLATQPVPGDAALMRRALLHLLRAAGSLVREQGALHLTLRGERERHGLELRVAGADPARFDGPARDALSRFAVASGGESSLWPIGPHEVGLALWLPARVAR